MTFCTVGHVGATLDPASPFYAVRPCATGCIERVKTSVAPDAGLQRLHLLTERCLGIVEHRAGTHWFMIAALLSLGGFVLVFGYPFVNRIATRKSANSPLRAKRLHPVQMLIGRTPLSDRVAGRPSRHPAQSSAFCRPELAMRLNRASHPVLGVLCRATRVRAHRATFLSRMTPRRAATPRCSPEACDSRSESSGSCCQGVAFL